MQGDRQGDPTCRQGDRQGDPTCRQGDQQGDQSAFALLDASELAGRSTDERWHATLGITLEGFEMLQVSGVMAGRRFICFGFSELNLTRLRNGLPIYHDLDNLGLPELDVLILYAATDDSCQFPYFVDDTDPTAGFMAPAGCPIVLFLGERNGREILGIALTDLAIDDLRSGAEMRHPLVNWDRPEHDIVLTYGLTEDAIQRRIEAESGLLPKKFIDYRTAKQKRDPKGFGRPKDE